MEPKIQITEAGKINVAGAFYDIEQLEIGESFGRRYVKVNVNERDLEIGKINDLVHTLSLGNKTKIDPDHLRKLYNKIQVFRNNKGREWGILYKIRIFFAKIFMPYDRKGIMKSLEYSISNKESEKLQQLEAEKKTKQDEKDYIDSFINMHNKLKLFEQEIKDLNIENLENSIRILENIVKNLNVDLKPIPITLNTSRENEKVKNLREGIFLKRKQLSLLKLLSNNIQQVKDFIEKLEERLKTLTFSKESEILNLNDEIISLEFELESLEKIKITLTEDIFKDIKDHEFIFSEVETIVSQALHFYPDAIDIQIPCIRLLYIQGNYYLYTDRPVLAQKKLLEAKALCEKNLDIDQPLEKYQATEISKSLLKVDPHLPSFYAMILRLLGKAYVFPGDQHNQLQYKLGKALLIKSIEIREYIDSQYEYGCFADELDNNSNVGNTHIFKRDLGYLYLEQNELDRAENFFREMMQVNDNFNHFLCLKRLVRIYQKKGQQAKSTAEKENQYQNAMECASSLLLLCDHFPKLHRLAMPLIIIAELHCDQQNPFRDIELSQQLFEKSKKLCDNKLKSITPLIHRGLVQIYLEIANAEKQQANNDEWEYSENSSTDFLREINDHWERQVLAYEEMGDIYVTKKKYLISQTLYSNALSILNHKNIPSQAQLHTRLLTKMEQTEYEFDSSLSQQTDSSHYLTLLTSYRSRLHLMRQQTHLMIDCLAVEDVFAYISRQYKELLKDILCDLITQMPSLPIPNQAFTLICGGSTSWNMATPYSDVELAFLIAENSTPEYRTYIKKLAMLLALRLIAIGETPIGSLRLTSMPWLKQGEGPSPRGFMLDPLQLATAVNYLIGTPHELATLIHKGDSSTQPNLQLSFTHFTFVHGNLELSDAYEHELIKIFNKQTRARFSHMQLWRDLTRWEPKGYYDASGKHYSLKHDLYRSFDSILYDLAFKFWIRNPKSPWELITTLEKKQIIDATMAIQAQSVLNILGKLRIKAYLHAKCQQECLKTVPLGIKMPLEKEQSAAYPVEEKTVLEICQFLANFHAHAKSIEQQTAATAVDYQAQIFYSVALIALQYHAFDLAQIILKQAIKFYSSAYQNEDFCLSNCYIALGQAFVGQGKCALGLDCITNQMNLNKKFYGTIHPKVAENHYHCGLALTKAGHYHEAKREFQEAIRIDTIMYGNYHLRLAKYQRDLGLCLMQINDPVGAQECFKQTLAIDNIFLGKSHPTTQQDENLFQAAEDLSLHLITIQQHQHCCLDLHLHNQCDEELLAQEYFKTHPPFKAQRLYHQSLHAKAQGADNTAEMLMTLAQLVSASYYKIPAVE